MKTDRRRAFTTAELLVVIAISALVLVAVGATFVTQIQQYRQHSNLTEMRQSLRITSAIVSRDVRMAGYGLFDEGTNLTDWVDWVAGVSNVLQVEQGVTNSPDRLFIVGALDDPVSRIATATSIGDTVIGVSSGSGTSFNTTSKKLLFIGRRELVRVVSVSGDKLAVTTHPSVSGMGLRNAYPVDSPVEMIEVAEYSCKGNIATPPYRPYLMRDNHKGSFTNDLQLLVSMGIEDFQVEITNGLAQITLTGLSQREERKYVHPVKGDRYRRTTIEFESEPRN